MAEMGALPAATVLFMPSSLTCWSRMRPQIRACQDNTVYQAHVLVATSAVLSVTDECKKLGIPCHTIGPFDRQDRGRLSTWLEQSGQVLGSRVAARWLQKIISNDRLSSCLPVGLLRGLAVRRRLKNQTRYMIDLLSGLKPAALLVQGDRELGPVPPILRAARDLNIPVVIAAPGIPSKIAMGAVRRGQARFLTRLASGAPLLNVLAAHLLPGQTYDAPQGRLLFSPGWLTLTMKSLQMLSANPWCQGGGYSDKVIIDGKRKAGKFIAHGIPEEKLSIVGDLDMDVLHRASQRKDSLTADLQKEYDLDPGRQIYIYAAPSYGEQNVMPMDQHLADLETVFRVLGETGENILISLHPKSSLDVYGPLAERYGLKTLNQRLFDVMPAANLFLCGGSTTMEWAMLCEVPTIDIDYAKLCDSELEDFKSVVHITEISQLAPLLERFKTDAGWRQEMARQLKLQRDEIALFDGHARDRFLALLDSLTDRSSNVTQPIGSPQRIAC